MRAAHAIRKLRYLKIQWPNQSAQASRFQSQMSPRARNPKSCQKIRAEYEVSARSIKRHVEWRLLREISSVPVSKSRGHLICVVSLVTSNPNPCTRCLTRIVIVRRRLRPCRIPENILLRSIFRALPGLHRCLSLRGNHGSGFWSSTCTCRRIKFGDTGKGDYSKRTHVQTRAVLVVVTPSFRGGGAMEVDGAELTNILVSRKAYGVSKRMVGMEQG